MEDRPPLALCVEDDVSARDGSGSVARMTEQLLVSPAWLVAHHADPNVRVIDPRKPEDYASGHVPGSIHARNDYKDLAHPLHVMRPDQAQAAVRALGISANTSVIVLGDGMLSGRAWWFLRYHGHSDVRIADGGFAAYVAAGGAVATDVVTVAAGDFTPRVDPSLIARAEDVRGELGSRTKVLDVRSDAEWQGSNTMDHERVGHVPGAAHVVWTDMLAAQEPYVFRTPGEIRGIMQRAGITPQDRVVTVCEVGWRAAHSAFALRLAGFDDVRVYDASMREWDNRADLPLEPPETV
jgi:thiosulfate/3-mercaptopyruvate sulfurtransferase